MMALFGLGLGRRWRIRRCVTSIKLETDNVEQQIDGLEELVKLCLK
jgi:hypothetical protein